MGDFFKTGWFLWFVGILTFLLSSCTGSGEPSCPEVKGVLGVEPTQGFSPFPVTLTVKILEVSPSPFEHAKVLIESDPDIPALSLEDVTVKSGDEFVVSYTYTGENTYRPRAIISSADGNCRKEILGDLVSVKTKILPQCIDFTGPTSVLLGSGGTFSVTVNDYGIPITAYRWLVDFGNDGTYDRTYVTSGSSWGFLAYEHINHLGLNSVTAELYTAYGDRVGCGKRGITVYLGTYYFFTEPQYRTGKNIAVPFWITNYAYSADVRSYPASGLTFVAWTGGGGIGVAEVRGGDASIDGFLVETYCTVNSITGEVTCEKWDKMQDIYLDPTTFSCVYAGVSNIDGTAVSPIKVYTFSRSSGLERWGGIASLYSIKDYKVFYAPGVTSDTILAACDTSNTFMWTAVKCSGGNVSLSWPIYQKMQNNVCDMVAFPSGSTGNEVYFLKQTAPGYQYELKKCPLDYTYGISACTWSFNDPRSGEVIDFEAGYFNGTTYIAILRQGSLEVVQDGVTSPAGVTSDVFCSIPAPDLTKYAMDVSIKGEVVTVSAANNGLYVYRMSSGPQLIPLKKQCGTSGEVFVKSLTDGAGNIYVVKRNRADAYELPAFLTGSPAPTLTLPVKGSNGPFVYSGTKMVMASVDQGLAVFDASDVLNVRGGGVRFERFLDLRSQKNVLISYNDVSTGPSGSVYVATSTGIFQVYPDAGTFVKRTAGNFTLVHFSGDYVSGVNSSGYVHVWRQNNFVEKCGPFLNSYAPFYQIASYGNYFYLAGGIHGVIVIDANSCNSKTIPVKNSSGQTVPVTGISVSGGLLFTGSRSINAMGMFDLSNPFSPAFQGWGSYPSDEWLPSTTLQFADSADALVAVFGVSEKSSSNLPAGFTIFRTPDGVHGEYGVTGAVGSGSVKDLNILQRSVYGYNYLITLVNDWVYFIWLGRVR